MGKISVQYGTAILSSERQVSDQPDDEPSFYWTEIFPMAETLECFYFEQFAFYNLAPFAKKKKTFLPKKKKGSAVLSADEFI